MRRTRTRRLRVNSKLVKDRREALGLTLDQAAARIGISRQALFYIEQGFVRFPHRFTLLNISTRLGIPLNEVAS